jgi:Cu-Zn family superoxide dismutase
MARLMNVMMGGLLVLSVVACGEKGKEPPPDKAKMQNTTPTDPDADPSDSKPAASTPAPAAGAVAWGKIESRSGSTLTGEVTFTAGEGGKVEVKLTVEGATPGDHAVHVHEKGDCSDPEGKSAGGHFNPKGMDHGNPTGEKHHPGDFGNLTAGADGKGTLTLTVDSLTVDSGEVGVIGKAVIVHEKADDFMTQPTGNAGGRQGCAVIAAK